MGSSGIAVFEERVELAGFVEDRVSAQFKTASAHLGGEIVGQDNHVLMGPTGLAGTQNGQAGPALEEKVHDGQVPIFSILLQGEERFGGSFGNGDHLGH